jgi:YVTN family beta-propeller protein
VISPDGTKVFVPTSSTNVVWVISTATNRVIKKIKVGSFPQGISIGGVLESDLKVIGYRIYVANQGSNTVSVINSGKLEVFATIPVGAGPVAYGKFAY